MRDGYFMHTSCGSPNYAAPEVIAGKSVFVRSLRPYCGNEADIWSCGVILFALLSGTLPFDDDSIPALYSKIRKAQYHIPKYFTDSAKDLISKMLQPNPARRISIQGIMTHPWVAINLPMYLVVYDDSQFMSETDKQNISLMLGNVSMLFLI